MADTMREELKGDLVHEITIVLVKNKVKVSAETSLIHDFSKLIQSEITKAQEQLLQDIHLFIMQEASTYMNSKMSIKGFEKDYTDGISDGKNNAYIRLAQWLETKRKELKGNTDVKH